MSNTKFPFAAINSMIICPAGQEKNAQIAWAPDTHPEERKRAACSAFLIAEWQWENGMSRGMELEVAGKITYPAWVVAVSEAKRVYELIYVTGLGEE